MIEVEAKFRITKSEMERLIEKLGPAKFIPQKNTYYSLGSLDFRVREENENLIINFKGKNTRGKYNSRREEEIFFDLSSKNQIYELLDKIGAKVNLSYVKRRANYDYGGCAVSIDLLPYGMIYVEIEGNEKNIERCSKKLGIQDKKNERKSYYHILKQKREKK